MPESFASETLAVCFLQSVVVRVRSWSQFCNRLMNSLWLLCRAPLILGLVSVSAALAQVKHVHT